MTPLGGDELGVGPSGRDQVSVAAAGDHLPALLPTPMHSNDSLSRRQLSLPSLKFHTHLSIRATHGVARCAAGPCRPSSDLTITWLAISLGAAEGYTVTLFSRHTLVTPTNTAEGRHERPYTNP